MKVGWSSTGGKTGGTLARRVVVSVVLLAGMLTNGSAQSAADSTLNEALRKFEAAMRAKDLALALSSWQFETEAARSDQEMELRGVFSAAQVRLTSEAPAVAADAKTAITLGTLAQITEPRGAVEQWTLNWVRTSEGWKITERQSFGGLDGLVHLDLQKTGFIANGQSIELEDFSLKMTEGTFFLNTPDAGPTSLVFIGKGRVAFKPRPATERGQMKIFAKAEILDDEVSRAFLRLHPADLYRTLRPGTFVEDPKSGDRLSKASEFFERHKADAFVLDAPIEGAPWWLLPGLGDAAIAFETKRFGTLTLTLSAFDPEGVSLFSRGTQRQIAVYPRVGADPRAQMEQALDVIHHDVSLSVNPDTFEFNGRDTVTLDLEAAISSFRFRLDDDLQVRSVRSREGGRHLFFRVRGQNSVLVSMGSLAGRVGRMNLTVSYGGRLTAGTVESEIMQVAQDEETPAFFIDPAFIYSKRRSFYVQFSDDDYATSNLNINLPLEWTAVAGGARSETSDKTSRTVSYQQTLPSKYLAFVVGRLQPFASEKNAPLTFDVYGQSRTRRDSARTITALKAASQLYSRLFGPMPYANLNLAMIEAPVPGGHSPSGLIILQQRPALMGGALRDDPATFWEIPGFFLAHELAHQWWGHGVTPRSYRDRWVSEGFAQYAAALWARDSQGEETFERVLRKMVTWVRRLSGSGPVDLGNRVGHIQNDPQAHRAVVYNKGALVLDMVRRLIGDDAFGRGLVRLQTENRFGKVDSEMVRRAFEAEASIDLAELWDVFIRNTDLPTMKLEARPNGAEIVVEGYSGPLPVVVRVGNTTHKLVVSGRLAVPGAAAGVKVTLDPNGINLVGVR